MVVREVRGGVYGHKAYKGNTTELHPKEKTTCFNFNDIWYFRKMDFYSAVAFLTFYVAIQIISYIFVVQ